MKLVKKVIIKKYYFEVRKIIHDNVMQTAFGLDGRNVAYMIKCNAKETGAATLRTQIGVSSVLSGMRVYATFSCMLPCERCLPNFS